MSLPLRVPNLSDSTLYEFFRGIISKAIDGTRLPFFVDENNQTIGVGTTSPRSAVKMDVVGGDLGISDAGAGINLKTPDGTKTYRIFIDNDGIVSSVQLTLLALCLFSASASAQVGSTNTYLTKQATQTVTADKLFTVLHSSSIGGRVGSNGVNFSSNVVINGNLVITGAITPSTAPSLGGYAQLAATQTFTAPQTLAGSTNTVVGFLQASTVVVTGYIELFSEVVSSAGIARNAAVTQIIASCSAGKKLFGGGCKRSAEGGSNVHAWYENIVLSSTSWSCKFNNGTGSDETLTATISCGRFQ